MNVDKPKILVVEDNPSQQLIIRSSLEGEYELHLTDTANQALRMLRETAFSLIILDLILPDSNGYELCVEMRRTESAARTPIIMLTSRSSDTDKIMGFSLGADDYLTKPFNPFELRARVQAKMRWLLNDGLSDTMKSGIFEAHLRSQRLFVVNQDEKFELTLTALEFRLLRYFFSHVDHVLSRKQILDSVWGQSAHVVERTVDTHVSKLRRKLSCATDCIQSVHGAGYRYTIPRSSIWKSAA